MDIPQTTMDPTTEHFQGPTVAEQASNIDKKDDPMPQRQDAFGDEEFAEVKYKVLKWWYVTLILASFPCYSSCRLTGSLEGKVVCLWLPRPFLWGYSLCHPL